MVTNNQRPLTELVMADQDKAEGILLMELLVLILPNTTMQFDLESFLLVFE